MRRHQSRDWDRKGTPFTDLWSPLPAPFKSGLCSAHAVGPMVLRVRNCARNVRARFRERDDRARGETLDLVETRQRLATGDKVSFRDDGIEPARWRRTRQGAERYPPSERGTEAYWSDSDQAACVAGPRTWSFSPMDQSACASDFCHATLEESVSVFPPRGF